MATFDLVLLSSSPPTSSGGRRDAATPPSNQERVMAPAHPSISLASHESSKIITSGALKPGSRAAPIPQGAERGFATASSLVRSHHFSVEPEADLETIEKPKPKRKVQKPPPEDNNAEFVDDEPKAKPRKTKAKANTGGEEAATNTRSRSKAATTSSHFATSETPVSGTATNTTNDENSKPPKPPRAKRTKKAVTESTTTVVDDPKPKRPRKPRAKADHGRDKTSTIAPPEAPLGKMDGDSLWDVPKSPSRTKGPRRKRTSQALVDEALDLEEAVARRQDWTPVKDTCTKLIGSSSATKDQETLKVGTNVFTSMISSFALANAPGQLASAERSNVPEGDVLTKRRRVELIDLPVSGPSPAVISPEKGKASKKKARTITDIVTGQYTETTEHLQSTSGFFPPQTVATTTTIPLNDITNEPKRTERTKQPKARVSKPKKAPVKASAKAKIVAEKLLSPASAAARVNRQDLLFGTSSQLALEESPTMIREIQRAIKESEYDVNHLHTRDNVAAGRMQSRLEKAKRKLGLWAASARDDDGDLLEKEDIRLPEPDRTQDFPLLMDSTCNPTTTSFEDIDDFELPCPPHKDILSDTAHSVPLMSRDGFPKVQQPSVTNMSFEDIDDFQLPPPSNQDANSSFLDIDDFVIPSVPLPISLTTVNPQVVSTVSPLHTKGVDHMPPPQLVSPLKAHTTQRRERSDPKLSSVKASSTPPSKSSQRRFVEVDEILDSEDDEALSPTPPRGLRLSKSPPLNLVPTLKTIKKGLDSTESVVPVCKVPNAHLQWSVIKSQIFSKITAEIRSLPPSNGINRPTWHEKILMYDAIPLEKFTDFLNTSTSIRTWRRATQKQVKAFNKGRKSNSEPVLMVDDEGDEALVVEKELESWMVQSWCQEMSVCCVSTDNKGPRVGMGKGLY